MNRISHEGANRQQYANAANFNARIHLHRTFGTNKYPWPFWVFDQLKHSGPARVLELGCGTGLLWTANARRIPADWDITLSDHSAGMLEECRKNLGAGPHRLKFEQMDIQDIPYADDSCDIVIANHMLYHVPDRTKALSEIKRVVKPNGVFYASTIGEENMLELKQLLKAFDPHTAYEQVAGSLEAEFSLENGAEQLRAFFGEVQLVRYEDALSVTDPEALVQYVLSLNGIRDDRIVLSPDRTEAFRDFIKERMQSSDGKIDIRKPSGLFISKK